MIDETEANDTRIAFKEDLISGLADVATAIDNLSEMLAQGLKGIEDELRRMQLR